MREFAPSIAGLAAILLLCSFQQPEIRVQVEAVNVLVTVTDQKGRFITDLARERFRVIENGVLQPVTHFSHQTDLPLIIGLLIDTSASVRLKLDFQKKAATDFLYTVMRPRDQALLVEFDTGVSLLHDFTNSPGAIAQQIKTLRAGGGTALLDALYTVCRDKLAEGTGRKAIVLVSDGLDVHSQRTAEEALRMVQSANVLVYTIGTTRLAADVAEAGERLLQKLAAESGGAAFFPYSSEQLDQPFELINEELRSQYSLTYVPINKTKDGKFRQIAVKILNGKGFNVRHRKGYYAPAPS